MWIILSHGLKPKIGHIFGRFMQSPSLFDIIQTRGEKDKKGEIEGKLKKASPI